MRVILVVVYMVMLVMKGYEGIWELKMREEGGGVIYIEASNYRPN